VIVNEFRTLYDEVWFATASQVKRDGFELGPLSRDSHREKGAGGRSGGRKYALKQENMLVVPASFSPLPNQL
jgi:hypothetical protein